MINFTAIDFETANGKRGSVCAAGITKVVDGEVVRSTSCLVTPPPGLGHFAGANIGVHGIRPRDVVGAPDWPRVLGAMLSIIGDDLVVAHNAAFERSVVQSATRAHGIVVPTIQTVCSVQLAKALLPDLPRHKLPDLAAYFGVPQANHHDAGEDARVCAQVTVEMVRGTDCVSLEEMLSKMRYRSTPTK